MAMKQMTPEQFKSLQDNVLANGRWDSVDNVDIRWAGDHLGVQVGGMYIGIEPDGYAHS
jgi:hypothetical protein